jgi:alpha-tubulin suppressor-like RCC1 family protein
MPIRLIWISRWQALTRSPKRKRNTSKSARIIGLFLLLALSLSLVTAGAASGTTASGGKISWARLTKKSFAASQAKTVNVIFKFSKASSRFSYELQMKKKINVEKNGEWRKVTRWKKVESVMKRGHFNGRWGITVKTLFHGKAVRLGFYKIRLSADMGSKTVSFSVIKAKKATEVSAGSYHTCALLSSGKIWCWGDNDAGELGNGDSAEFGHIDSPTAVEVRRISTATQVAAGGGHTCALLSNGTVECWGASDKGQLGNGSTYEYGFPAPVEVTGIQTATQVAVGEAHTCALLTDGRVECWGYNYYGQLGDGSTDDSATPVEAKGISNATQVSAGYQFTCALLSDGTVRCWGLNDRGQLGDGTTDDSSTPVEVTGISTATQVAVGFSHACALLSDGKIECWGLDNSGQLGDGPAPTYSTATPVEVKGISTATQITAGGFSTCARLSSGKVECWGSNRYGQLGNGSIDEYGISTPVEVKGISTATQVAAGEFHTCALLSGGRVDCWGVNGSGQLGDGTHRSRRTPVEVAGL